VEAYNYFLLALKDLREGSNAVASPTDRSIEGGQVQVESEEPQTLSEAELLLNSARTHRESGNLNQAVANLEKALELEPANPEILQELESTQEELKKLITLHLNEGIKLFNQEELEEAIQEWEKVLELDPANKQAANYREQAEKRLNALKATE
jgi:tetratricopeptide (TPR) repeat protein